MEKSPGVQLELFTMQGDKDAPGRSSSAFFLSRIKNFEKAVLFIIALTITNIISFSLGVEKGKNIVSAKSNPRFDVAATAPPQAPDPVIAKNLEQKDTARTNVDYPQKGFAIQLASYKTKTNAEKEAIDLRKKGLNPIILSKGNYIVLYVGTFSTKQTALTLLTDLKKRYAGCIVRRL